jgi:hypothetical protein
MIYIVSIVKNGEVVDLYQTKSKTSAFAFASLYRRDHKGIEVVVNTEF